MKLKKTNFVLLLLVFSTFTSWGQIQIRGTVVDSITNKAIVGAEVLIAGLNKRTESGKDGGFVIPEVMSGVFKVYVVAGEYKDYQNTIRIGEQHLDLVVCG